MKQKILLLAALALLAMAVPAPRSELCLAKDIPPCSCVPLNIKDGSHWYKTNPDSSIILDTCNLEISNKTCDSLYLLIITIGSYTKDSSWNRALAKYTFKVVFPNDAIILPKYPDDTTIFVSWDQIDTAYPKIRTGFKLLSDYFGTYHLKKYHPERDTGLLSNYYDLTFENWVSIFKVEDYINSIIGYKNCEYQSWLSPGELSVDESNYHNIVISPIPASDFIYLNRGLQALVPCEQIKIYNTFGECVMSLETGLRPVSTKIDVSVLPSGVYFVRCGEYQPTKFTISR